MLVHLLAYCIPFQQYKHLESSMSWLMWWQWHLCVYWLEIFDIIGMCVCWFYFFHWCGLFLLWLMSWISFCSVLVRGFVPQSPWAVRQTSLAQRFCIMVGEGDPGVYLFCGGLVHSALIHTFGCNAVTHPGWMHACRVQGIKDGCRQLDMGLGCVFTNLMSKHRFLLCLACSLTFRFHFVFVCVVFVAISVLLLSFCLFSASL